ncbi:MAG: hypothetical protein HZB46_18760 [Solirubrobacterales bacterium]|nr:hypothetical protein [Solirubrobacterales bacterium]
MRRLAVLVLAAVALAGCAERENADYVDAFDATSKGLAQRYGLDRDPPANATAAQLAARIARIQGLLREWARRLERVDPPNVVDDAHARYIAGLRGFARDLDRTAAALRGGDVQAAQRQLDSGRAMSARTRADLRYAQERFDRFNLEVHGLALVGEG